jgi:hypothetical protein
MCSESRGQELLSPLLSRTARCEDVGSVASYRLSISVGFVDRKDAKACDRLGPC